ncbi:hypothetical protein [uncultured Helicobacter sp.]|uniref:hypothetical protein n=1 Tax=uncultured Helicobacter sp. TaxID=175537 RepID=UPI00260C8896|nr:hypothetical protein [uncultured Helicobacter sp.]
MEETRKAYESAKSIYDEAERKILSEGNRIRSNVLEEFHNTFNRALEKLSLKEITIYEFENIRDRAFYRQNQILTESYHDDAREVGNLESSDKGRKLNQTSRAYKEAQKNYEEEVIGAAIADVKAAQEAKQNLKRTDYDIDIKEAQETYKLEIIKAMQSKIQAKSSL